MVSLPSDPDPKPSVKTLPHRIDISTASALRDWFLEQAGNVRLDASQVEVVTTPGLQVLIAARNHLRSKGLDMSFEAPSPDFLAATSILGFDPARLTHSSVGGVS